MLVLTIKGSTVDTIPVISRHSITVTNKISYKKLYRTHGCAVHASPAKSVGEVETAAPGGGGTSPPSASLKDEYRRQLQASGINQNMLFNAYYSRFEPGTVQGNR